MIMMYVQPPLRSCRDTWQLFIDCMAPLSLLTIE